MTKIPNTKMLSPSGWTGWVGVKRWRCGAKDTQESMIVCSMSHDYKHEHAVVNVDELIAEDAF